MDKMAFIAEQMSALGVDYNLIEWTSDPVRTYTVGEFTEAPTTTEDGYEESTCLLTTTTRGTWAELYDIVSRLKRHFPASGGLCATTGGGAIAVFFSGSFPVPTGEADLKRIQTNLSIKEWKVTL